VAAIRVENARLLEAQLQQERLERESSWLWRFSSVSSQLLHQPF
jgi:hypothetical protein